MQSQCVMMFKIEYTKYHVSITKIRLTSKPPPIQNIYGIAWHEWNKCNMDEMGDVGADLMLCGGVGFWGGVVLSEEENGRVYTFTVITSNYRITFLPFQ